MRGVLLLVVACGTQPQPQSPVSSGTAAAAPGTTALAAAPSASSPHVVAAPGAMATQISAGGENTCARMSDSSVRCWGNNQFGQAGAGAEAEQARPRPVPGLTGVAQVAVGDAHVCVLMQDGAVRCWGSNYYGALGLGDEAERTDPTVIPGLRDVTQVAAGWATCALLKDASVTCWGDYDPGSGDPRSIGAKSPVKVLGITDAVEVAVGRAHSCARRASGAVTCWRHISPGLVPRGKVRADPAPVRVTDATRIALSSYGAAVTKTGQVRCWGYGSCGFDVGLDTGSLDYGTSFPVPKVSHVVEVGMSDDVACVRKDDGTVACQEKTGVVAVPGITKATQLAVGAYHACALIVGGTVMCWGRNSAGQLGDGTKTDRRAPTAVAF